MLRPIMGVSVALAFMLGLMGCGLIGGGGDTETPEVKTPEEKVEEPTKEEEAEAEEEAEEEGEEAGEEEAEEAGDEKAGETAEAPAEEKAEEEATQAPATSGFNKGGRSTGGRGSTSVAKPKK